MKEEVDSHDHGLISLIWKVAESLRPSCVESTSDNGSNDTRPLVYQHAVFESMRLYLSGPVEREAMGRMQCEARIVRHTD